MCVSNSIQCDNFSMIIHLWFNVIYLWFGLFTSFLNLQKGKLCTQTNTCVLEYSVRLLVMSLCSSRALCKTTVYFDVLEENFFLNSALEFGCSVNIYVETSCPEGWCFGHDKDCCCHLIIHERTVKLVLLKVAGLLPQNDPRTEATICVEMDVLCFKPKCTATRIKVDYLTTSEAAELMEIINTEIIEHCHVPLSTGFMSQARNDDNIILISESNVNDSRLQDMAIVNLQEASLTEEDTNSEVLGASKLDNVTTQGYDVGSNWIRTKTHAVGKRKQEPSQESSEEDDDEHGLWSDYQFLQMAPRS